jgi:hypothetical protein
MNHDAAGERLAVLNRFEARTQFIRDFVPPHLVDATCIRPRGASSARLLAVKPSRASSSGQPGTGGRAG